MRPFYIIITVGLLSCGCQGTGPAKHDNPVVGPPPPRLPVDKIRENQIAAGMVPKSSPTRNASRISVDDLDATERVAANNIDDVPRGSSGIQRISLTQTKDRDLPPFDDGMVVAMVNDQPIFAGEVLSPARQNLAAAEKQLKAEYGKQYKPEMLFRVRAMFIRSLLQRTVERKMLVLAAKSTFKKQQMEGLGKAIDAEWAQHLEQMMQQNKVTSINELEVLLKENNFDMEEHEAAFRDQQIAMNFISYKAHSKFEPTRKEMLSYYEEHQKDYEFPSRVHWQQLLISNEVHGGEAKARQVLDKVVKELLAGADFGETVKKYGDGPKASNGGIWDWTVKGSLANKELEKELFTLPAGEMSGVIQTASGFQIVQVLDRQDAGRQSFESKQKEIEAAIKRDDYEQRAKKAISEIKAATIITTVFDEEDVAEKEPAGSMFE